MPRTNRGIFAVNELPDLAERIQVALLNVLEERDIQVRGYQLRLPLDVLLVASANPEDYTNRGRIITPLKDRFGAEIRTHYPLDLDFEIDLVRQEASLVAEVPDHLLEVVARYTRAVRESPASTPARACRPGSRSPRPRRSPRRRCAGPRCSARPRPVARIGDAVTVTSTLRGKVEFESGEEGRETEILAHLLRTATAETFRARLAGIDLSGFTDLVAEGEVIETGELVAAARRAAAGGHRAGAGQGARAARASATRPPRARRPPASSSCSRACTSPDGCPRTSPTTAARVYGSR